MTITGGWDRERHDCGVSPTHSTRTESKKTGSQSKFAIIEEGTKAMGYYLICLRLDNKSQVSLSYMVPV